MIFQVYNEIMLLIQTFSSMTNQFITDIANKIGQKFAPNAIYLFGSHAWGTPNNDSDLDLLIVKDTENTREMAREIDSYLFPRDYLIDVLIENPDDFEKKRITGNYLISKIANKGKTLWKKK